MQRFLIGLGLVGGLVAAAVLLSPSREESLLPVEQTQKISDFHSTCG